MVAATGGPPRSSASRYGGPPRTSRTPQQSTNPHGSNIHGSKTHSSVKSQDRFLEYSEERYGNLKGIICKVNLIVRH